MNSNKTYNKSYHCNNWNSDKSSTNYSNKKTRKYKGKHNNSYIKKHTSRQIHEQLLHYRRVMDGLTPDKNNLLPEVEKTVMLFCSSRENECWNSWDSVQRIINGFVKEDTKKKKFAAIKAKQDLLEKTINEKLLLEKDRFVNRYDEKWDMLWESNNSDSE